MSLSRIRKFYQNIIKVDRFVLLGNLFLVALFFVSYEITKEKPAQTDKAGIQLTAKFRNWSNNPIVRLWKGKNSTPEIVLTFINPTDQLHTMVFPYPMHEYTQEFASPDRPTLVLLCKKASSRDEEAQGFVLAEFSPATDSKPKELTLKPGESVQVSYKLTSFYYFWRTGPQESKGFLNCLQPGKHKIAIRAIIAYSDVEPLKGDHLKSPSVVVRCDVLQDIFSHPH